MNLSDVGRVGPELAVGGLTAGVAGIAPAAPNLHLRAIGAELERLREKTPRGGTHWAPSSVAHILERARSSGLMGHDPGPKEGRARKERARQV